VQLFDILIDFRDVVEWSLKRDQALADATKAGYGCGSRGCP